MSTKKNDSIGFLSKISVLKHRNRIRSYQTLSFFVFQFFLLSLSVCNNWKKAVFTMKWPSLTAKIGNQRKHSLVGLTTGFPFENIRPWTPSDWVSKLRITRINGPFASCPRIIKTSNTKIVVSSNKFSKVLRALCFSQKKREFKKNVQFWLLNWKWLFRGISLLYLEDKEK